MAALKELRVRNRQRQGDAEDHGRNEDGRGVETAPRARRGGSRPPLCGSHGAYGGVARARGARESESAPALLRGTGADDRHLLVVATSDRGLCGGFNSAIVRAARARAAELEGGGRTVALLVVGRKGREALRRDRESGIVEAVEGVGARGVAFAEAAAIADNVARRFAAGEFDVCTLFYNRFVSAISQEVTARQLVPLPVEAEGEAGEEALGGAVYEFEPDEEAILTELLPRNMAVQVFRALLENAAGEQGARMMAMDNATRNAGDMIDRLTLTYNRSRQAAITRELIEIVSGGRGALGAVPEAMPGGTG